MRKWFGLLFKLGLILTVAVGIPLVYLNASLIQQFSSLSFAVGATVYARPLELYQGSTVSLSRLRAELEFLNYQAVKAVTRPGQYRVQDDRVEIWLRGHGFPDGEELSQRVVLRFGPNGIVSMQGAEGAAISLVRLDPVLLDQLSGREDRQLIDFSALPSTFVPMLLAVEDQEFYQHQGVSINGIVRALMVNVQRGRFAQGGSTLTQQLVKNLYLTRERTLTRKGTEVLYALLLEANFDKQQILSAYLNEVFLGQWGHRAVHGFATASLFYFGRPLAELSLSQQALLVGLVKGPSAYDPRREPKRALQRRNLVLRIAVEAGVLKPEEADVARQEALGVPPTPADRVGRYAAYVRFVQRELEAQYTLTELNGAGLRIYTAMDPEAHQSLLDGRSRALATLASRGLDPERDLQLGTLLVDIPTGDVLAMLSGRDDRGGFHRVLDAKRQIGSLVKPFVVAGALAHDPRLSFNSPVRDESLVVMDGAGRPWSPKNDSGTEAGMVTIETLLSESVNQATVHLALGVGMDRVLDQLEAMGLPVPMGRPPSTVLGVSEASPFLMAQAYQMLLNQGYETPLKGVRMVVNSDGRVLTRKPFSPRQRLSPAVAVQVDHMLRVAAKEGTGRAFGTRYSEQLAAKTGTTDGGRDAWFVGADGRHLGVAWVGFDNNRLGGLYGAVAALPIVAESFARLPREDRSEVLPAGLQYVGVNAAAQLVSADCPEVERRVMRSSAEVMSYCGQEQLDPSPQSWLERWFGG